MVAHPSWADGLLAQRDSLDHFAPPVVLSVLVENYQMGYNEKPMRVELTGQCGRSELDHLFYWVHCIVVQCPSSTGWEYARWTGLARNPKACPARVCDPDLEGGLWP